MITVLIWKKAFINLFITYFNIELKRTKLTSRTDTKLMNMGDRYRLRDDNSPDMEKDMHWFIYHIFQHWIIKNIINFPHRHQMRGLISCYQSLSPISAHGLISLWHFWCLCMGKIDVFTYKYVIIYDIHWKKWASRALVIFLLLSCQF